MIDNYTTVIYGWKIEGKDKVHKFIDTLKKIDEDYFDKFQNIIVEDTMCGNYLYFGAILSRYDAIDDPEHVIIDVELVNKKTSIYNKIIKENPELEKIFKKYQKEQSKLYIFQNIW